jgi:DNA (cytosine-5)-methyltransferase 1
MKEANLTHHPSLTCLDLFSGIGGFALGFERHFIQTVAFCEIIPFGQKVLTRRWPGIPVYQDVRTLTLETLIQDGLYPVDIVCGGFPCQDLSTAGKQAGITGNRSGLWSELCRIIGTVRPRYAVMENVANLLAGGRGEWFGTVLGDLAAIGYDAEWHCIPAAAIGARHIRDRVWIVAYPAGEQQSTQFTRLGTIAGGSPDATNSNGQYCQGSLAEPVPWQPILSPQSFRTFAQFCRMPYLPASRVCGSTDGIPDRSHRLRALGNAIVPQIAEYIGWRLVATSRPITSGHPLL